MTRSYRHPNTDDIEIHEVLRALADPIRLRIVELLLDRGETTCAPLAAEVGIADSTLSHHLRQMREAGVTRTRADGVLRWTSLRRDDLDRRFPGLLACLQAAHHPAPPRATRSRARQ
jgi:DNA-binding transcriptional ArsR family regulator